MSAINVLFLMSHELAPSIREMTIDEAKIMLSLINKSRRLILKGDEGLLELYDWLEKRKDITYEDALLLLFDHLEIDIWAPIIEL